MLATIRLNNQLGLNAGKIDDIGLNNQLPPKLETSKAASSKVKPETRFSVCHICP